MPSPAIFTKIEFDFTTLAYRLRELAFLNSGVTLVLTDQREGRAEDRDVPLRRRARSLRALPRPLEAGAAPPPIAIRGERDGIIVEIAMEWTDSYHETMLCFTNNIPQRDGGTHLAGFRGALTRTVNAYANDSGIAKREKVALTGEDMREGLTCILERQDARPEILLADQGQAGSPPGPPVIEGLVADRLQQWFAHPRGGGVRLVGHIGHRRRLLLRSRGHLHGFLVATVHAHHLRPLARDGIRARRSRQGRQVVRPPSPRHAAARATARP